MGLFGRTKKDSEEAVSELKLDEKTLTNENETSQRELSNLKKEILDAAVKLETYIQELEKAKSEEDHTEDRRCQTRCRQGFGALLSHGTQGFYPQACGQGPLRNA